MKAGVASARAGARLADRHAREFSTPGWPAFVQTWLMRKILLHFVPIALLACDPEQAETENRDLMELSVCEIEAEALQEGGDEAFAAAIDASDLAACGCKDKKVGPIGPYTGTDKDAVEKKCQDALDTSCACSTSTVKGNRSSIYLRGDGQGNWECGGSYQNPNPNEGTCN